MDHRNNENEMEKLSQMLSKIRNLYYKKKDQLEDLQSEIEELRDVLNYLNTLITSKSFHSADEIYLESQVKRDDTSLEEKYFDKDIPKERVEGTNIKRKIFSKNDEKEGDLLCILNFFDLNRVEIKFTDPINRSMKETSDEFLHIFIKGALVEIKETNPNLSLKYEYYKNSDVIERIIITQLSSIKDYDLITSKIRELLVEEISSDN